MRKGQAASSLLPPTAYCALRAALLDAPIPRSHNPPTLPYRRIQDAQVAEVNRLGGAALLAQAQPLTQSG
jgi:hypothetical protein